jgi:hypothetical protein
MFNELASGLFMTSVAKFMNTNAVFGHTVILLKAVFTGAKFCVRKCL